MTLSEMLTTEEGMTIKQELEEKKQQLQDELSRMDTHVTEWSNLAIMTFDIVKNLKERFTNGTIEQRKTILRVIGSNLTVKDKKIEITVRKPFEYFQEAVSEINSNARLEPNDLPDITSQSALFYSKYPIVGGRRGSNPQPLLPQSSALPLSYDHHRRAYYNILE